MKYATLVMLLFALLLPPALQATWQVAQASVPAAEPAFRVPLDKAVAQVQRRSGGRILSATTERRGGRYVHRIKLLTPDKRVVIEEVDAGGER